MSCLQHMWDPGKPVEHHGYKDYDCIVIQVCYVCDRNQSLLLQFFNLWVNGNDEVSGGKYY